MSFEMITKYEVPLNDIYFIPAGVRVLVIGEEQGFIKIVYKGEHYLLNELYLQYEAVSV